MEHSKTAAAFTLPNLPLPGPCPTQNFFGADLVFATAELLAAWKPATAGC